MTQPLITLEECDKLTVEQVHDLYRKYVNKSQVSLMTSFGFGRELAERAEGAYIYERGGRKVLDFTGGVGVLSHGHNHPRILAARKRFAEQQRMEVHKTYFSPYVAALGHNLAAVLPGDLNLSFFPNSGAEAVEGAVKLAYKYHGGRRRTILRADISFHGKLLGSGGLTAGAQSHFAFPTIPGIATFTYNDLDSVRRLVATHANDVYALLIEPFSASTIRWCSEEFLRGVREICTEHDIVLVFDEIYSGWGKTGSLFYFTRYEGLVPDVVTTSKTFGGGKSSISAYVAREKVFRKAYDNLNDALMTSTSTTYYGFGEECATAVEAIAVVMEEDFPARARAIGEQLGTGLRALQAKYPEAVGDVQGDGALWGIFIDGGPKVLDLVTKFAPGGLAKDPRFKAKLVTGAVINALYRDHALYTYYTLNGLNPLIFAPPLIVGREEVQYALDALDAVLAQGLTKLVTRFIAEKVSTLW
ncbi:MAG: aspartate aminotransferase family protein [Catenulispora sp.]|nr:aspartate aminotransferase family protein [Catenulispora sp.]